jgi:hypothetical protein
MKTTKPMHPYAHLRALKAEAIRRGASRLEREVLVAIALYADESGHSFPSATTLAADCGYGNRRPKELYEAIRALERKQGLLTVERQSTRQNRRTIVGFTIRWPSGVTPDRRRGSSPTAFGGHPRNKDQGSRTPSESSQQKKGKETTRSAAERVVVSSSQGSAEQEKQAWRKAGLRATALLDPYEPRDLRDALARLREIKSRKLTNDPRRFGAYLSRVVRDGDIPSLAAEFRDAAAAHAKRSAAAKKAAACRRPARTAKVSHAFMRALAAPDDPYDDPVEEARRAAADAKAAAEAEAERREDQAED